MKKIKKLYYQDLLKTMETGLPLPQIVDKINELVVTVNSLSEEKIICGNCKRSTKKEYFLSIEHNIMWVCEDCYHFLLKERREK